MSITKEKIADTRRRLDYQVECGGGLPTYVDCWEAELLYALLDLAEEALWHREQEARHPITSPGETE